jgi:hypothetical protein
MQQHGRMYACAMRDVLPIRHISSAFGLPASLPASATDISAECTRFTAWLAARRTLTTDIRRGHSGPQKGRKSHMSKQATAAFPIYRTLREFQTLKEHQELRATRNNMYSSPI